MNDHTPSPRWLRWLASVKLCVVLLALIVPLIFFGSLAQRHWGIWEVMGWYFKAPVVKIPFAIFCADASQAPTGWFPYPGGSLLGSLLLVNLGAAFFLHFRLTRSPGRLLGGLAMAVAGAALVATGHLHEPLRTALTSRPLIMLLGGLALYLPLLAGMILLYGRKAGLALSHLAIVLLVVGQAATTWGSRETHMLIAEGETAVYSEDEREYELAVIREKAGAPGLDRVETVVQSALIPGQSLTLPESGIKLEIVDWMKNAVAEWVPAATADPTLSRPPPVGAPFLADKRLAIRQIQEVTGVGSQMTNVPGIVVRLNGQPLALYGRDPEPATFAIGEKRDFRIALRPKRYYKPFGLRLEKFDFDRYAGTSQAMNYASRVTLLRDDQPPEVHVIRMNEPLRLGRELGGETFYQLTFTKDEKATVLQVVSNPSWTIPYMACALGAIGLLFHFILTLAGFLKRKSLKPAATASPVSTSPWLNLGLPVLAAALMVCAALRQWPEPKRDVHAFDLDRIARLPVLSGGRIQPLDSVARNTLLQVTGRSVVIRPTKDGRPTQRIVPVAWMLDMMLRPDVVRDDLLLRIDHPEVKILLELDPKATRFSAASVWAKYQVLDAAVHAAQDIRRESRNSYQNALLDTWNRIALINSVFNTSCFQPFPAAPVNGTDGPREGWTPFSIAMQTASSEKEQQRWQAANAAWDHAPEYQHLDHLDKQWTTLGKAWRDQDPAAFNAAAIDLEADYARLAPRNTFKAAGEARFNRMEPFWMAIYGYVCVAFTLFAAWLLPKNLQAHAWRIAMGFAIGSLIVHSAGIATRMWISGRPPVTNLYSSALFVGWGMGLFGLVCEGLLARFRGQRMGFALLAGAVAGTLTLLVAQGLSFDGDTLSPPQAVLDTNFWLATHVVIITLGYSATFLAGLLGIALLICRPLGLKTLGPLVTGIICFALLFSFIGTVLGGIWADQSWGRFWGWDPKENGAMIIVLWNAMVLHTRLAGWAKERGIAILAICGNIVTAWSWFGVNLMGTGLHSYGFTSGAAMALGGFCLSQILCLGLAFLPEFKAKPTSSDSTPPARDGGTPTTAL